MIKNYFKTAWRSLVKGKSFSVINIAGLAIGMAGAMVIFLWLQYEVSFDKFHINKDKLYEVYGLSAAADGKQSAIPVVSQPLGPALKQAYPEVEEMARVKEHDQFLLAAGDKSFTGIKGAWADAAFLQMFSFPMSAGDKSNQLNNVYSITITEKLARKLFGNEAPVGKIIKIDSTDNFTVTGVLKELPANTRFDFDYLLPWAYLQKLGKGYANNSWLSNNTSTFVQLKNGTEVKAFDDKIKNFTRVNAGRNDVWTHFIFPLDQWHLYNEFENGKAVGGRIETVRVFGIIAIFILLIACINFMNLSTARSEQRSKEVGIRKVSGAGKHLLVLQFITEAILTTCIAGIIATGITQLVLPLFNTLVNTKLAIPFTNIYFWLGTLSFIFFTGLLAGSYPAFYLSSFNPVGIFRKQFAKSQSAVTPRKVLVVMQFTFAIILIISTIIIRNQVIFAQDRDKGYSNNNLVQVKFTGDIEKNYNLIKHDLISAGISSSVTKTMTDLTSGGYHTWGLRWPNEAPADTNITITIYASDAGLVRTTGMQLLTGRDINIDQYSTDSFAVVLNETAVKTMGFNNPIGQVIRNPFENTAWHVVGVVKDYIQGSPYDAIAPTVIMGPGAWFNTMYIKLNPANATAANIAEAEKIFRSYNPAYPFDYAFVDEAYAKEFDNEQRTKTMAGIFAGLAIFISCLGLLGLSAFVAESRIKEIGVRKVLGASVAGITRLLSIDFIKLVLVSIVIATPIAWFVMNKWIQNYTYRTDISWWMFVLAGMIALVVALITVSFESVKAAIANPVKSLRAE